MLSSKSKKTLSVLSCVLIILIFIIDITSILNVIIWLFYLLPILLTIWETNKIKDTLYVSSACTVLLFAEYLFSPNALPTRIDILYRISGVILFWISAGQIILIKKEIRKINNQNRLRHAINRINQKIINIRNKEELYNDICRVAVESGNFEMAWIGEINQDTKEITAAALYEHENNSFILKGTVPDNKADAIRETVSRTYPASNAGNNTPHIDFNKEKPFRNGYNSTASFPFKVSNKTSGILNLYSSEKNTFDAESVKLLEETAHSLGTSLELFERKLTSLNEELEHRVEERTAELEQLNTELEAFSYSVSHDLRAPLRHINGFVDLLENNSKEKLDSKGLRYLKIISDSSQRMGRLIDELLTFSRMGRGVLNKEYFSINKLIEEILREHQTDFAGRNIQWIISQMPDAYGDLSMIKVVLSNLITNAVKYTRPVEEAVIEINGYINNDELIFSIKDNGVGFDMKYADKLFGVFQRLHSEKDFEGTGIGLANIRRIITRHGGKTWAESVINHGATFYFSIPILKEK